jgi:hypothetical protein
MGSDSLDKISGTSVMEEEYSLTKSPEWWSPELIGLRFPLADPIVESPHLVDE